MEKEHLGVLTGSPLTDVTITLLTGRAHVKHTEGGRLPPGHLPGVRQGLMQAESVLLEPWYDLRLLLPPTRWAGPCPTSSGWGASSRPRRSWGT